MKAARLVNLRKTSTVSDLVSNQSQSESLNQNVTETVASSSSSASFSGVASTSNVSNLSVSCKKLSGQESNVAGESSLSA